MATTDRLHELIHTLTPSEKRYFKVYIKRNALKDASNYELLFNTVSKVQLHDQTLLKKRLKNLNLGKQLHVTKHYLYNHILKSLELFYYQADIDKQLYSYKAQIQLLEDRGLYQQAQKLIGKALKLATTHEKFMDVAELTLWQSKALTRQLETRNLETKLDTSYQAIEHALTQLQQRLRLEYLDNKALLLIKKYGIVRDKQGLALYKSLAKHPSMDASKLNTFLQRYFYHHIMSLYHFATDNKEKNYHHRKTLVQLFNEHPAQKKHHESKYIVALNNLALVCNQQGKEQEFFSTLATLESIQADTAENRARVFTNSRTMWLMNAYGQKSYLAITDRTDGILSELSAFGNRVDLANRILFYYLLAAAHLAAAKDKEALKLLYQLLETPRAEEIQDLYRFARILLLMAHYKLGNLRMLESQTKSLYSYLRSKKKMYKTETLLLELMNELVRSTKTKEQSAAFAHFKSEYDTLMQDPYESRVSSYFHFGDWAEGQTNIYW